MGEFTAAERGDINAVKFQMFLFQSLTSSFVSEDLKDEMFL